MTRVLAIALLSGLLLAAVPPPPSSARTRVDGGAPGAGDGGPVVIAEWLTSDGGEFLDPRGVTDIVRLTPDASVDLTFPRLVIDSRCDDPGVARVEPQAASLRLRGLTVGRTDCGFWYQAQPFPSRFVAVEVIPPPR